MCDFTVKIMIFTGYNFQILDKLFAFKSSSWKNNMLISTNMYLYTSFMVTFVMLPYFLYEVQSIKNDILIFGCT